MEILKSVKAEGLNDNPSQEVLDKANRPTTNIGIGLYKNGYTIIPSKKVYGKTYSINGRTTEGAVFTTFLYDESGKFVKEGTVSTNALFRQLYPNTDDATGAVRQVENIEDFGNTAVEVASKLLEKGLCFQSIGVKPLCAPNYIAAENRMSFAGMTKRDYSVFKVVEIPETIKQDLTKN